MNPLIPNLVSTMLRHENFKRTLNLPRIAQYQGFDVSELEAEFDRQEAALLTKVPPSLDCDGEFAK